MSRSATGLVALTLALVPIVASAANRQVFVTSVSGQGRLGDWPAAGAETGLAAGDAICQARAAAGGLGNADGFRAWLSTPSTDAYCRIHGLTGLRSSNCGQGTLPVAAGPWLRTDDRPFGAGIADLLYPNLEVFLPPRLDEYGNLVHAHVWTATGADGESAGYACNGWTSDTSGEAVMIGSTDSTAYAWTSGFGSPCDETRPLLCFEIGVGDPLPSFANWGRLAFVTSATGTGDLGSWPEAGATTGVAAGDAICRSLAGTANLPNPTSFKAWLSTGAVDAVDRFVHDGPWMRPDRVRIADSLAGLTDSYLHTAISVSETGEYILGSQEVWTGTDATGVAVAERCGDWTDGTIASNGGIGRHDLANNLWTSYYFGGYDCDASDFRLYCLQDLPLIFGDGFESGNKAVWTSEAP